MDARAIVERLRGEIRRVARALSRYCRSHPHFGHAHTLHVPRLPARRNRGDRRIPAAGKRPARRRQAQSDVARPRARCAEILHERLGYRDLHVPDAAFDNDATGSRAWLRRAARRHWRRALGPRFRRQVHATRCWSTTTRSFFPASEKQMYLSGPPLHVLAMQLVRRFRQTFGDRFPISFSGRHRRRQFRRRGRAGPEAGHRLLGPVEKRRLSGYARGTRYLVKLWSSGWTAAGAADIDQFVIRAYGQARGRADALTLPADQARACRRRSGAGRGPAAAAGDAFAGLGFRRLPAQYRNLRRADVERSPLQRRATTRRRRKSRHATVAVRLPDLRQMHARLSQRRELRLSRSRRADFPIERLVPTAPDGSPKRPARSRSTSHGRSANFADACNECGNCDVFCPEDGGPYLSKPLLLRQPRRLGGDAAARRLRLRNLAEGATHARPLRRRGSAAGKKSGDRLRYVGEGFDLYLDPADPAGSAEGESDGPVDLTPLRIIELMRTAVTAADAVNFISAAIAEPTTHHDENARP